MRPELQAHAAAQGGVFRWCQAVECGYSDREIRTLARTGEWVRIRWGGYVERSHYDVLDEAGRYGLLVRAALLRVDPPALASHQSSGVFHRLPLWGTDLSRVHLARPDVHCGRKKARVSHHEAAVADVDRVQVEGVGCTSLRRTPLDVAREYGFEAGVVAADAALGRGVEPSDMLALATSMKDWPGSPQVMQVARFADGGAESPGESLARMFLAAIGMPPPRTQVVIRSGGFVARVDLLIEELGWIFEFDGRVKYRRTRDACDPVVDDGDIVWAEKRREDVLRDELDYSVSRLVWAEMFGMGRRQTAQRLWAKAERLGVPRHFWRAA